MKKTLMVVLALVLVIAMSVAGTMAYLTDNDSVTNTFTVGKVDISLDEAKVETNGAPVPNENRVKANTYHLIPGHSYTKDPTVHVDADSENCYVFVKVENGISSLEAVKSDTYSPIADQIIANGWTSLTGVANVYYKTYDAASTAGDKGELVVFEEFMIAGNADLSKVNTQTTKIVVTAYAVQADGFNDAADAWANTFGAPAKP